MEDGKLKQELVQKREKLKQQLNDKQQRLNELRQQVNQLSNNIIFTQGQIETFNKLLEEGDE